MNATREYRAETMVRLPTMTGNRCSALCSELSARADQWLATPQGLPDLITRAKKRLDAAREVLNDALGPEVPADPEAARSADQMEDACWSALRSWLEGYVRLAQKGVAGYDDAVSLHRLLFDEGLSFLLLGYEEQWTQSELRLEALVREGYEATIERLGGEVFLDALRDAHAAYGEVLGITEPSSRPTSPSLQEALQAAGDVIRDYVLKVVAHREPDNPETAEMVEDLLYPLLYWDNTATGTAQERGGEERSEE